MAECDERVRAAPNDPGSYYCYTEAAAAAGEFEEPFRRLEAIYRAQPDLHRALLNMGLVAQMKGDERAEALLRQAATKMEQAGDRWGVVYARTSLGKILGERGLVAQADAEHARALEFAEEVGDPILWAHAATVAAYGGERRGDWGRQLQLLRRAEAAVFPDGPDYLKSWILSGLGQLYWMLGDEWRAMELYLREVEVLERMGNRFLVAVPKMNIAQLSRIFWHRGELSRDEHEALTRDALASAIEGGDRGTESLGWLLVGHLQGGREAIVSYRKALALADSHHFRIAALLEIARATHALGAAHRHEAWAVLGRAEQLAHAAGDRPDIARTQELGAELHRAEGSLAEARRAYLRTLEAIESMRDQQPEATIRARLFSQWLGAYYGLAACLLQQTGRSPTLPSGDLELAFHTVERMRARMLLDRLDVAGAAAASADDPLHLARRQVLGEIAALQKELMDPELDGARRREALRQLESLEDDEQVLRDRIARIDPVFAALRTPPIPSLEEVRSALAEDEAILSFQLGYLPENEERRGVREESSSWVWVIHRDDVRAIPVPSRTLLEEKVQIFTGLFENRDGSEAPAAAGLFEDLLDEALRELPPAIDELVIVPDGPLYRLPFAALRPSPGEPPVAAEFDISYVPSVAIWSRWKTTPATVVTHKVVALADPVVEPDHQAAVLRASDPLIAGVREGRLPAARQEAEALLASLGGGVVRLGAEASESFIKNADLDPFGMLVFAAHAVVDDDSPDRSAVLLAPGASGEDGLLQMREIVDLDLRDRVVVLSGCRSVLGPELRGEGIMGLAHAFFQAGARAVIGSLWPVRDDEAALLVSRFAAELGRGRSLGRSLAAAQQSLIGEGVPAVAWAGFVVLGDGDLVPVPGGQPYRIAWSAWLALVLGAGAAWVLHRVFRRRRRVAAAAQSTPTDPRT